MKHHGFQRWFSLVCNCSRVVNHKDKQELRPLWFRLKFSNSVKLIFSCFRLLLLKNSLLLLLSLFYIPGNVIYKYSLKDTHGLNTHVSTTELQKWVMYLGSEKASVCSSWFNSPFTFPGNCYPNICGNHSLAFFDSVNTCSCISRQQFVEFCLFLYLTHIMIFKIYCFLWLFSQFMYELCFIHCHQCRVSNYLNKSSYIYLFHKYWSCYHFSFSAMNKLLWTFLHV